MKPSHVLVALVLLAASGCRDRDVVALEPYTNIPPGSVIILRTKANGKDYTSFPARNIDLILTNECVLEEIKDGSVMVSNFHGVRLGFAGGMVSSIEVKEMPTSPPNGTAKP